MTYFIDPYKKYYDKLSGMSSLSQEATNLAAKVSDAGTQLSSMKSSLNSSSWKEMGIEEIASTTIPSLIANFSVLQTNITNAISNVVTKALGELLPELAKLKETDEKLDQAKSELNSLVVVPMTNIFGQVSSQYNEYISKKNSLEATINELKTKCEEYVRNCDTIVTAIKACDGKVTDFAKPQASSAGATTDGQETPADQQAKVTILDAPSGGKMYKVNFNGSEFYVANTKINLFDYEQYILKNGMYQDTGYHGSQCNLLSQNYAVDLMRGTYSSKDNMATDRVSPATRMNKQVRSQDEKEVLQYVYDEVSNGRPVALQVTQKRSNEGLRHFVTVVGFDASVKSINDLTPDKILVMDCYDGKVQTLSTRNRKLFNQGGKGYYALGATDTFLAKEVYKGNQTMNA